MQISSQFPAGYTKCSAIDVPETTEPVEHGEDVKVGKCVHDREIGLQIILWEDNDETEEPGEDGQTPGEGVEDGKWNHFIGDAPVSHLVVGPHILELCHFGAVSPGGKGQQKVRQEDADEDNIVDDLVKAFVRGGDEF